MNTKVPTVSLSSTFASEPPARPRHALLRYFPTAERILLGLMFAVFGLDGFLRFIPQPTTPMPEGAIDFATALIKTGYMFPLIKGTELLVGLLLLSNRFVPLALVLLAPVMVNIVAFNVVLAPGGGIGMVAVLVALHLHLAWQHRAAYRPLLVSRSAA